MASSIAPATRRSTRAAVATSLHDPLPTTPASPPKPKVKRRAPSPTTNDTTGTPAKKPRAVKKERDPSADDADPAAASALATPPASSAKKGKGKATPTPKKYAAYLQTPYPEYSRPTAEDCEEVTRLLGQLHGVPSRPGRMEKLREDGEVRVGEACGAVPNVLDALIRTILSQNTTNANSARAYASMIERFGPSRANRRAVSLPAVYRAAVDDIRESIKSGGLSNVKSKVILNVLRSVHARNSKLAAASTSLPSPPSDAKPDPDAVKQEDDKTEVLASLKEESDEELEKLLSLDYVHEMTDDAAMRELESFPGVGPKTASCVLLFCLERDSFAVDTHVFRLSKSLGWVPSRATRETAYEHLDVRIPPHLKYPLHVLLIAHGKSCGRCSAGPIKGRTTRPEQGACPLVGLKKAVKEKEEGESGEEQLQELANGEVKQEAGDVAEEVSRVLEEDVAAAINEAHGGAA